MAVTTSTILLSESIVDKKYDGSIDTEPKIHQTHTDYAIIYLLWVVHALCFFSFVFSMQFIHFLYSFSFFLPMHLY
jgi:hypothetical protein